MIVEVEHRGRTWQIVDENKHTEWVIGELGRGWETDTFETIDEYVNGGVFVDVGAWIGMFSLYAAPHASWVYAFEPDPVAHDMLVRNLALNGVENVTVFNAALSDHDGEQVLYCNEMFGDSMTGPMRHGEAVTFEAFSTARLRELAPAPDLVKVDTEGSEWFILPGIIDWPVPIHLSVHIPEMPGRLDYRDRQVVQLTHGSYHTVLLP